MTALLNITDGTTTINLIGSVFRLVEDPRWRPQTPQFKGGGVWQSSPLADGRRLASTNYDNVVDAWTLHVVSSSQDDVIYSLQELRRLLTKAVQYWTTDWQDEPVWIEARASCETNTRYAIVKSYQMPEDDDPYQQPFINAHPGATMNDIQLIVEHGIWTDTAPGVGTATEIGSLQEWCPVTPLLFDGTNDNLNLGSPAVLDDLHDNAFTVEAWIKPEGWGKVNLGRIADKSRWIFNVSNGALVGTIVCAVANGVRATSTTLTLDAWAHVAMTWDDAVDLRPRIWIDGTEAAYLGGTDRNGVISSDAAQSLYVGDDGANTFNFDGDIGWLRISNSIRYAAGFTPPSRCVIPATDATTVWLGIVEGQGATCYDRSGNANNGAITGAVWDADEACCEDYGRAATTTDEVYITNHHKKAQLTHVFYYDASVPSYSANLLGEALPYALFPAVPAVGDICYFGIDATLAETVETVGTEAALFFSLVFDLIPQTDITSIVWEQHTGGGGWAAIAVTDYTNNDGAMAGVAFDTAGAKSVCFLLGSPIPYGINGAFAFWIRARIAGVGGAPTPPQQQNRNVYTVSNACVDIDSLQITGDIPATLKMAIRDVGDRDGYGGAAPDLYQTRCICGLRSLSRGSDFTPYLFCAGPQNLTGVTVTYGALTASLPRQPQSPSGYCGDYENAVGASALIDRIIFTLSPDVSIQYYGRFRVFIRCNYVKDNASANTIVSIRLRYSNLSGGDSIYSETAIVDTTVVTTWYPILDCGVIEIPGGKLSTSDYGDMTQFAIQIADTVGTDTSVVVNEVILMPVDEWAGDFYAGTLNDDAWIQYGKHLNIDSTEYPKEVIRSIVLNQNNQASASWRAVNSGGAILQANRDQRLWFLFLRDPATLGAFTTNSGSFESLYTVQLERQARYLSMRGAR